MDKITFCIPSKSNLRYLKTCIPSIRKNAFRLDHDIIIFVDSDEDDTVEWLEQVKDEYNLSYYVNPNLGKSLFGIGKAYDYCIEKSTTDVFMIFHADMMLGKDADKLAFDHLDKNIVVSATRVEPPIHPNAGEKILKDFGMWPEEFKEDEFNNFVLDNSTDAKTTDGVFAPWMMYKEEFLAIGGHDEMMHSCREDSDVFNRLKLAGFTFIQPWNSLVYHLTGRGAGSFEGDEERHRLWQIDMMKSTKEFIRKWGSNVNHTPLMNPIVSPKYNIGFIINNASMASLSALETWCTTVYIHDTDGLINKFIAIEQPNTKFSLIDKILNYDSEKNNDILVEFDVNTFNQEDFIIIQQLGDILKDSGEIGTFQISNLTITINSLTEYQSNLIKI
jgi:glycosyltransferase involved in cell wall biosynthesis